MRETDSFDGGHRHLPEVGLHPRFPELVWLVVEQPAHEEYRLRYKPESGTFASKGYRSLGYARGFPGAYGWVGGLGTPPAAHCDAALATDVALPAGEVVAASVCGARRDPEFG